MQSLYVECLLDVKRYAFIAALLCGVLSSFPELWAVEAMHDQNVMVDCQLPKHIKRVGRHGRVVIPEHVETISMAMCQQRGGLYSETKIAPQYAPKTHQSFAEYVYAKALFHDQDDVIAVRATNFVNQGKYDQALQLAEEGLFIAQQKNLQDHVAAYRNLKGMIYAFWGQYDRAMILLQTAYALIQDETLFPLKKHALNRSIFMNNIGRTYWELGEHEKALIYLKKSLALQKKSMAKTLQGITLINIADIYREQQQYAEALQFYQSSYNINHALQHDEMIAESLNGMAQVYLSMGLLKKALKYARQSFALADQKGFASIAIAPLNTLGQVYFTQHNYPKSIKYYQSALKLIEQLRITAQGDTRRDYLAKQINTYQSLTSAYLRHGEPGKAFHSVEMSRAKRLAERLSKSNQSIPIPSTRQIQRALNSDTAYLVYANVSTQQLVQILLTDTVLKAQETSISKSIAGLSTVGQNYLSSANATPLFNQRSIKIVHKSEGLTPGTSPQTKIFKQVIQHYRQLLINPALARQNDELRQLSRKLYQILIKPMQDSLQGKKKLVIFPDDMLGFLPFETLIDEQGRYLVETYDISYAQSFGVLQLIKQRTYQPDRKPMLAFGGAVYDEASYVVDMVQNTTQLALLDKKISILSQQNRSVRDAYHALGINRLNNLPGTLSEVRKIQSAIKHSEIITGSDASESHIKKLSNNGALAQYKVLHFATHGIVVPDMPQLSAVILSQFKKEQHGEDGFLRMTEIASLNIKADFVNLSACETGLGKIYGGEGVVGLTQSFLLAGANALSVSLWQVADQSTSAFMIAMYKQAEHNHSNYTHAINLIKRRFIQGDFGEQFKHPFYWAPFVYYGQTSIE